ncbi:hypothetical protein DSM104329_01842 [Capillimicrobium parvum]|uniref:Uncharacterized protein n=2 Tax=Capillimicrobium parvum TaxID=2884022 RepID=A0A9E6XVZ5_9ACTN|nr:hypothetical protein DSM104329_01842 [Capillimicrobium parvum]
MVANETGMPRAMHPAAHHALRELSAAGRHLTEHWSVLAGRLAGPESVVLRAGADSAAGMLTELYPMGAARDVPLEPAADALGAALGGVRGRLADRFLERNQALRAAVLDVQHVTTLLAYVEALVRNDGDDELADACAGWQERLWAHENAARGLAIAAAEDPDQAIAPADGSPVGRAAHRVASVAGAAGEWVDRQTGSAT